MSLPEIEGYEVLSLVARGGMGAVYRARQVSTGRQVALKVVSLVLSSDGEFILRFKREAASLASLSHPGVAQFIEYGQNDQSVYLAMEFVEGEPLSVRVADGPLPVKEACLIAAEVAEALCAAHKAGLIHRDVKPSNIILSEAGARLTDFGLARSMEGPALTTSGRVMGSLPYMSPEQIRGERLTHLSDLYSLGVVLFEMVTGGLPFEGADDEALVGKILTQPAPLASRLRRETPVGLDLLLIRLLSKQEDLRPLSAAELGENLREIASGIGTVRTRRKRRRRAAVWQRALGEACRFFIGILPPGKTGSRIAHSTGEWVLSVIGAGEPAALRIEAGLAVRRSRESRRELSAATRKRDLRLKRAQSARRRAAEADIEERQSLERFAREMVLEAEVFEKRMDELAGKALADEERARALEERAAAR